MEPIESWSGAKSEAKLRKPATSRAFSRYTRVFPQVYPQNTRYFAGIPGKPGSRVYTWKIPGNVVCCRFPRFCLRFCPRTSSQAQGNSRVSRGKLERKRMEHQTPSGFPRNFRKLTQSAGDPLVSLWVAGNSRTGQLARSSTTTNYTSVLTIRLSERSLNAARLRNPIR